MKEIPLRNIRQEIVAWTLIDDEDFNLVNAHCWYRDSHGYARHNYSFNGKSRYILLHRFLMNTPKDMETDHINGNRLDNRKNNLRVCTTSENQRNSCNKRKNNTSGFKGVHRDKDRKKWRVTIYVKKKCIYCGSFDKLDDAAKAYDKKAKELFGEFAKLNYP